MTPTHTLPSTQNPPAPSPALECELRDSSCSYVQVDAYWQALYINLVLLDIRVGIFIFSLLNTDNVIFIV